MPLTEAPAATAMLRPQSRFAQPVAGDLAVSCISVSPEHTNAHVLDRKSVV